MENITKIRLESLPPDSPYMKPARMFYIQKGEEKTCDILRVHDSVSIVIFNVSSKKLVFVKQFRPAVYYGAVTSSGGSIQNPDPVKYPPKLGVTLELCGGMIDKTNFSPAQIAREELREECGFDVPVGRLKQIFTFKSTVEPGGASQIMFYCKVSEADRKSSGGGVDDELIDVVEYSIKEAKEFVKKGIVNNSPPNFLLGIQWFLGHTKEVKKPR